jgi:hypothetical protein
MIITYDYYKYNDETVKYLKKIIPWDCYDFRLSIHECYLDENFKEFNLDKFLSNLEYDIYGNKKLHKVIGYDINVYWLNIKPIIIDYFVNKKYKMSKEIIENDNEKKIIKEVENESNKNRWNLLEIV